MKEFYIKKTSVDIAGQNVQSQQSTNQLSSTKETFSQDDINLIKPLPNGKVDARGLWEFLGSKKQFADWVKQNIESYEFVEDLDFHKIVKPLENNKIDFEFSISCAKEICMVSKTIRGKKARKYFLEMEKIAQAKPTPELSKLEWIKLALEIEEAREKERLEKEQIKLELTQTKTELNHKQEIILERVSQVPVQNMRTKLNKICRWTKQGDFQYRWRLLYKEFTYTYTKNLRELADNAEMAILDYAEKFGHLENLYNLALKLFETEREDGEKLILS